MISIYYQIIFNYLFYKTHKFVYDYALAKVENHVVSMMYQIHASECECQP